MQTHIHHKEGLLEEGADFSKKEGGLRVLTRTVVTKVAEMLRQRRQQAQETPPAPESMPVAEPEKKEEWRPGEGTEAPAPVPEGPVMAMALRARNLPNRKRLSARVNGTDVLVLVRDTGFYRQGEQFEVRQNEYGEWEAAHHRTQPRFR
jgi:hypothetical protein